MIGKVLDNRYEIVEQIGIGGMALVYKAKCNLLNRYVAIKVLKSEFVEDEDFIRKFKRESQAAASLSHPNILNIYDVGVEEVDGKDTHYIVMEYIRGQTLKDIIKDKGKIGLSETLDYAIQIGEALKHAHFNNIIHRDIKPQNIMINEDNMVKVTDFGIARAATSSTMTTTSKALGSVHYLSPEQARGAYTDEKSDIYSLGIVMYEMATGKLPYEGETPVSIALKHIQNEIVPPRIIDENISEDLESIILKCVEKKQFDRYSSVEVLLKDLRNLRDNNGEGIIAEADSDDSPTRIIPIIKDEDINSVSDDSSVKDKKKKRKGSGRLKPILLGILLAFLLVSITLFGYTRFSEFFKSKEVVVPNVIGMAEEEARELIESKGLKFEVQETVKDSNFNIGDVVRQDVKEGSKVKEGFTIRVIINEGDDLVSIPGLFNKTLKEAEKLLEEVGLKVGTIKYESSDTTPKNLIMRQAPDSNTSLEKGSEVNVVISKGEEIKKVIMPDVRGKSSIEARNILLGLDLQIGQIKEDYNSQYAKGTVFRQSYKPGVELNSKTTIDIYISLGEKIVEPPPVEETPEEPTEDPEEDVEENPEEDSEEDLEEDEEEES